MNTNLLKKVKIIIIILILMILIVFIGIFVLNLIKKEKNTYDPNYTIGAETRNAKLVEINEEYYAIKTCIDTYYSKINSFRNVNENNYIEDAQKKQTKEAISNSMLEILDQEYINNFDITKDKISALMEDESAELDFIIDDMYVFDGDDDISIYIIYGKEISKGKNNESGFIVKVDRENGTFSIIPYEYLSKNGWYDVSKINYNKIDFSEIEINDSNTFSQQIIDNEDIAINIFEDYKNRTKYDIEKAYDSIEKEYREKRFKSLKKYIEYIEQVDDIIKNDKLVKIKTNYIDDEQLTEYVCLDIYGNYFIFKGTGSNYSVVLDIYTIERDEFKKEYQKATEVKKVALNLEKFKQMINGKDYEAAYEVLDEKFRDSKFGTVEKFKEYIEDNWFKCNNFSYGEVEEVGGVYTLNTDISDAIASIEDSNGDSSLISKTFAMKLSDETDFVMSFNVD